MPHAVGVSQAAHVHGPRRNLRKEGLFVCSLVRYCLYALSQVFADLEPAHISNVVKAVVNIEQAVAAHNEFYSNFELVSLTAEN
jgi:hypothetical protein